MQDILYKMKRKALDMFSEVSPLEQMRDMPPSMSELRRLADRYKLSDLLPYESYDDINGLYWNTETVGILLQAMPTTGLDQSDLNVLSGVFAQGLEPGTTVQFTLIASPDIDPLLNHWKNQRSGSIHAFLTEKRVNYLRQGAWKPLFKDQPQMVRDFKLLVSLEIPKQRHFDTDSPEIKNLVRVRDSLMGVLSSAKIFAEPCHPDELLNIMDVLLNPTDQPRMRAEWNENGKTISAQMVSEETAIWTGRDSLGLTCNGFEIDVRPFSVRQYPKAWAGWSMGNLIGDLFSNLLRIPSPFIYTVTAEMGDPVAMATKAKFKAARATQMTESPLGKFVPAWAERKQEWQFVTKLQEDGHRMVNLHWQGVLFSVPEEADFAEQRFKATFESRGWRMQRDRFIALPAFLSAMPMSAGVSRIKELGDTGRLTTAMSWTAINTAPLVAEWKGTGTPLLMLVGRRGQLQMIDNFDNTKGNYNIACAAASGAGKSFFTQELIMSTLGTGGRCWAIDSGRSYESLCGLVGGDFLEFSTETNICLNPFTRIVNMDETLPVLTQLFNEMATGSGQPLNSLQQSYVQEALTKVWQDYGNQATVTHVASFLQSNQYDGAQIVGRMLFPYTKNGAYARFFEGEANINLDNPFVVLELGELDSKRDLRSVVLMLLMTSITEAMYLSDRKQKKLCIIDEAWKLMSGGNAGEFIEEGYRIARKFGGAFMTVTQGINDYYKSPTAEAALANADWMFLLRQKPEAIKAALKDERLASSEGMASILSSIDTVHGLFSEIAVVGPEGMSIGRLIVDSFSEKLYSTQAAEYQAIKDMQAQGMTLVEAIDKLAQAGGRL